MKKLILTGLSFIFAITLTFAQEVDPQQKAQEAVAVLTEKLTLSEEQQAAIYPIVLEKKQAKAALEADTSLSAEELAQRVDAIKADSHAKIAELLNDEQKEAFVKFVEEKKQD